MLPNLYVLPQIHVDLPALLFPVTGHYRRFGLVIGGDLEIINASPHWEFEEQPAVQKRTVWCVYRIHPQCNRRSEVCFEPSFFSYFIYLFVQTVGSQGMRDRGMVNPLLEYADKNGIDTESLTLPESSSRDHQSCFLRTNFVPFQRRGVCTPADQCAV